MHCQLNYLGFWRLLLAQISRNNPQTHNSCRIKKIIMLTKLTSKNQLTLPKSITRAIGDPDYFEVKVEGGQIILTPVKIQRADAVRSKLAALGINEQDIDDAVAWTRQP